jgi:monomeric sarcosine oxidase
MKTYDAVVLGLGTMGSATIHEIARRKARVLGFDQFSPPHGRGSHGGQTRVFRAGYAESPEYVPLVEHARGRWAALSQEFGTKLLTRSGLLTMGLEESAAVLGIQRCGDLGLVDLRRLSAEEIRYRYPAFGVPDEFIGLLEPDAGWLDVDAAISGMQKRAETLGAELCLNEAVNGWEQQDGEVLVRTAQREVHAKRLVITAGAWTADVLRSLGIPIRIVRKTFVWFNPVMPSEFAEGAIPIFGFPTNAFYGFPNIRGEGVKVSEHSGGDQIGRAESAQPAGDKDHASVLAIAGQFLPSLAGETPGDASRIIKSSTCLYAVTPDEHFILDVHPEYSGVVFAAGFSGHGFKFAPVIGEVMADLALEGRTPLPIDFLRWKASRISKWNRE